MFLIPNEDSVNRTCGVKVVRCACRYWGAGVEKRGNWTKSSQFTTIIIGKNRFFYNYYNNNKKK